MAVSHCEKMAVLQPAKVWHCNPSILVLLMRVGRRLSCLGCESKLRDTVSVHLSGVSCVVGVLLLLGILLLSLGLGLGVLLGPSVVVSAIWLSVSQD